MGDKNIPKKSPGKQAPLPPPSFLQRFLKPRSPVLKVLFFIIKIIFYSTIRIPLAPVLIAQKVRSRFRSFIDAIDVLEETQGAIYTGGLFKRTFFDYFRKFSELKKKRASLAEFKFALDKIQKGKKPIIDSIDSIDSSEVEEVDPEASEESLQRKDKSKSAERTSLEKEERELSSELHFGRFLGRLLYSFLQDRFSYILGGGRHEIERELRLSRSLFESTIIIWGASLFLVFYSSSRLLLAGLEETHQSFQILFSSYSIEYKYSVESVVAAGVLLIGACVWFLSLIFCVILRTRPWMTQSDEMTTFLKDKILKNPEAQDVKALFVNRFLFVEGPFGNADTFFQDINWPYNYQVGRVVKSPKHSMRYVLEKRPMLEPITFRKELARVPIMSAIGRWEEDIIQRIKAAERKFGMETVFLGEVIDDRVWSFNRVFAPIGESPHFFVIGKTGSGKTKSLLSMILTYHYCYPDTQWLFADGKNGADFDVVAKYLSRWPVAKLEGREADPLVQFANILVATFTEFERRQSLFEATAREYGRTCASILEYREITGKPLSRIFLVVDEFQVFVDEMAYNNNSATPGTLANQLRRIAAQGRSFGVHLIFATQRFQVTDMPSSLRSNLTTQLIHGLNKQDAIAMKMSAAERLGNGQFILKASGVECGLTGHDEIRAKFPYIGGDPTALIEFICKKPVPESEKRSFDKRLIYEKGSDDFSKMEVRALCLHVQKFLREQDYLVEDLIDDYEAQDMQMSAVKVEVIEKREGKSQRQITHIPGAPKLGVSILKETELNKETLSSIQDVASANGYSGVLVVTPGMVKDTHRALVKKHNEMGPRILLFSGVEYSKNSKQVLAQLRKGVRTDIVFTKFSELGVLTNPTKAAQAVNDESHKAPFIVRAKKLFEKIGLENFSIEARHKSSVLMTILPGGRNLAIIPLVHKNERYDAQELAHEYATKETSVLFLIEDGSILSAADLKKIEANHDLVFTSQKLNDMIQQASNEPEKIMGEILGSLGLINDFNQVVLQNKASIDLYAKFVDVDGGYKVVYQILCSATGYRLQMERVHTAAYTTQSLGINKTVKINLHQGFAPMGTIQKQLVKAADYKTEDAPSTIPFLIKNGILEQK